MRTAKLFSRSSLLAALLGVAMFAAPAPARAKVTRIVIDKAKSESPTYGGKSFGKAGQYEKIVGRAYGELDPKDPHNAIIQDIQLAPRNARGMVEYVATFTLLKPVDMSKASNVLLYEVVNRGRKPEPGRQRPRLRLSLQRMAGRYSRGIELWEARSRKPSKCRSREIPMARRSPGQCSRASRTPAAAPLR